MNRMPHLVCDFSIKAYSGDAQQRTLVEFKFSLHAIARYADFLFT